MTQQKLTSEGSISVSLPLSVPVSLSVTLSIPVPASVPVSLPFHVPVLLSVSIPVPVSVPVPLSVRVTLSVSLSVRVTAGRQAAATAVIIISVSVTGTDEAARGKRRRDLIDEKLLMWKDMLFIGSELHLSYRDFLWALFPDCNKYPKKKICHAVDFLFLKKKCSLKSKTR